MVSPSSAPETLAAYARQVPVVSLLSTSEAPGVDTVRSDDADGIRAAGELLAEGMPSAVLAFNDRCALGVLEAAWRVGLTVPQQPSVTGYDDSQLARLGHVQLTTVSQDAEGLARAAVACAAARIRAEEPGALVLQPRLVVRSTTGPVRA